MARILGPCRMEQAHGFGTALEEFAHLHGMARVLRHADRHRAHAAQRQPGVVGADGIAHRVLRAVQLLGDGLVVRHHRAQHQVGVTAHVLRAGNDGHLRPQRQRAVDIAGAPGVVGGQHQAVAVGDGRHGAHVQHFKQQRARRFHIQQLGVGLHQGIQVFTGREVGDADVHALEHGVVQLSHRAVNAVGNQRMVARRAQRHHHHRHRRQARRCQIAVRAAFQVCEDLFQRGVGIHAHAAVGGGAVASGLAALRLLQRGQVLEPHGAGAHGRQRHGRRAGFGVERGGARVLQYRIDVFGGHLQGECWRNEQGRTGPNEASQTANMVNHIRRRGVCPLGGSSALAASQKSS
ncbi:hypothetical protein D3C72_1079080 [compost metagenome]